MRTHTNRRGAVPVSLALLAGVLAAWAVAPAAAAGPAPAPVEFSVLNPAAVIAYSHELAPRLGDLNGKTVALYLSSEDSLYGDGGAVLDALGAAIRQQFPQVRLIPYSELPRSYKPEDAVVEAIVSQRPDAVIGGVGG